MSAFMTFIVDGVAETKGSWRAIGGGKMKRDNPREKAWADRVGWIAKVMMRGKMPIVGGALVAMDFMLPQPVGRKNQRDLDKLARSILDAMTGIVYVDDELVREMVAHKEVTSGSPHVEISVFAPLGVRAVDLVKFWIDQHDAFRKIPAPG